MRHALWSSVAHPRPPGADRGLEPRSLHDALPIYVADVADAVAGEDRLVLDGAPVAHVGHVDRKSTRLNSSHANISYAVFCLKKKTCASSPSPHIRAKRRPITRP